MFLQKLHIAFLNILYDILIDDMTYYALTIINLSTLQI